MVNALIISQLNIIIQTIIKRLMKEIAFACLDFLQPSLFQVNIRHNLTHIATFEMNGIL